MHQIISDDQFILLIPILLSNVFLFGLKGHLLVLQNFNFLALNHGVMEADYLNHPTISGLESSDCEKDLSVSMVASIDTAGNLLLGKFLFCVPCK